VLTYVKYLPTIGNIRIVLLLWLKFVTQQVHDVIFLMKSLYFLAHVKPLFY